MITKQHGSVLTKEWMRELDGDAFQKQRIYHVHTTNITGQFRAGALWVDSKHALNGQMDEVFTLP